MRQYSTALVTMPPLLAYVALSCLCFWAATPSPSELEQGLVPDDITWQQRLLLQSVAFSHEHALRGAAWLLSTPAVIDINAASTTRRQPSTAPERSADEVFSSPAQSTGDGATAAAAVGTSTQSLTQLLRSAHGRVFSTYTALEELLVQWPADAWQRLLQNVSEPEGIGAHTGDGQGQTPDLSLSLPIDYLRQMYALSARAAGASGQANAAPTAATSSHPQPPVEQHSSTIAQGQPAPAAPMLLQIAPDTFRYLAQTAIISGELARRGVPDRMVGVFGMMAASNATAAALAKSALLQQQAQARMQALASAAQVPPLAAPPRTQLSAGSADEPAVAGMSTQDSSSSAQDSSDSSTDSTSSAPPSADAPQVDEYGYPLGGRPEYPELLPRGVGLPGWDHGLGMAGLLYGVQQPIEGRIPTAAEASQMRMESRGAASAGFLRLNLTALQLEARSWEGQLAHLGDMGLGHVVDRLRRRPPPALPPSQDELDVLMRDEPHSAQARAVLYFARASAIRHGLIHAWRGYTEGAWGHDVLRPHSGLGDRDHCDMGVTIVDTVDTSLLMGLAQPYSASLAWATDNNDPQALPSRIGGQAHISLFECTIRILGGLLAVADLTHPRADHGPSLDAWTSRAEEVGRVFMESGAWLTPTGIPYGTMSLANRTRDLATGQLLPVSLPAAGEDSSSQGSEPTDSDLSRASYSMDSSSSSSLSSSITVPDDSSVSHPSVPSLPEGAMGVKTTAGHAWNPGWAGGASSVSEVATLQMEHTDLSKRLGVGHFHALATRAGRRVGNLAVADGLFTMMIDPANGNLKDTTVTLGARGDSTYEYLLKQWLFAGGWRYERKRSRALSRAAVALYMPVWMARRTPQEQGQGQQGAGVDKAKDKSELEAGVRKAMSYLSPARSSVDDPRWLLSSYNRALHGVLDGLLQRSTPANYTYIAEAAKSRSAMEDKDKIAPLSLLHKMDHLVCFLPGVLGLGAAHGAGHEVLAVQAERAIRLQEIGAAVGSWLHRHGLPQSTLDVDTGAEDDEPLVWADPHPDDTRHLPSWMVGTEHGLKLARRLLNIITQRWAGEGELAYDLVQVLEAVEQGLPVVEDGGHSTSRDTDIQAVEVGIEASAEPDVDIPGPEPTHEVHSTPRRGNNNLMRSLFDGLEAQAQAARVAGDRVDACEQLGNLPRLQPSMADRTFCSLSDPQSILNRLWDEAHALAATCAAMSDTTSTGLAPEIVTFKPDQDFAPNHDAKHCLLRPEAVESFYVLHALTGEPSYVEAGWRVWTAIEQHGRVRGAGYASVADVEHGAAARPTSSDSTDEWWGSAGRSNQRDRQESFALAETFKYLYLMHSEPAGTYGPTSDGVWPTEGQAGRALGQPMLPLVVDYSGVYQKGAPGLDALLQDLPDGGPDHLSQEQWVYNTEAHPLAVPDSDSTPSKWGVKP